MRNMSPMSDLSVYAPNEWKLLTFHANGRSFESDLFYVRTSYLGKRHMGLAVQAKPRRPGQGLTTLYAKADISCWRMTTSLAVLLASQGNVFRKNDFRRRADRCRTVGHIA